MINIGTPGTDPLSSSLHHGDACRAAASCFDPRKVSDLHDGVQHGLQPLPSHTCLPSGTPHKEDVNEEIVGVPFSTGCHTLGQKQIVLLLNEGLHAVRSIFCHTEPRQDNQDAYMVCSVLSARFPPSWHEKRTSREDPVALIHFVSIRIPHLDTGCQ